MERRASPRKTVLMSGRLSSLASPLTAWSAIYPFRARRSRFQAATTSPSASTLSLRRTTRTFPVTSSGAKRSGSAWPST